MIRWTTMCWSSSPATRSWSSTCTRWWSATMLPWWWWSADDDHVTMTRYLHQMMISYDPKLYHANGPNLITKVYHLHLHKLLIKYWLNIDKVFSVHQNVFKLYHAIAIAIYFRNVQVVSEDSDVCNIKGLPNGTTRGVQLHRTQGNHLSACSSQCHACHVQVIVDIIIIFLIAMKIIIATIAPSYQPFVAFSGSSGSPKANKLYTFTFSSTYFSQLFLDDAFDLFMETNIY